MHPPPVLASTRMVTPGREIVWREGQMREPDRVYCRAGEHMTTYPWCVPPALMAFGLCATGDAHGFSMLHSAQRRQGMHCIPVDLEEPCVSSQCVSAASLIGLALPVHGKMCALRGIRVVC